MSCIEGIATAVSLKKWAQAEVLEYIKTLCPPHSKLFSFYRRFLSDRGIESRHFALEDLNQVHQENADEAILRFQAQASLLGAKASKAVLKKLKISSSQIDALIVTTCTGYLCPGLTSYLAEALNLRTDVSTVDLVGTGCGAAIPALRTAHEFVRNHPKAKVLVVCVEICSAAMAWGEEVDLILSNCLFSDGAAACVVSQKKTGFGIKVNRFESLLWPKYRDELRFEHRNGRLKNVIKKSVPELTSKAVLEISNKLKKSSYDYVAVHPGGRKILDHVEKELSLPPESLRYSREVLKRYGNMSSPSILFVLKLIWEKERSLQGKSLLTLAFGAGFSAFGVDMEFTK